MGIKTKNCEEYSTLQGLGRVFMLPVPVLDVDSIITAASAQVPVVGTALTLAVDHVPAITLWFDIASGTCTLRIVGYDQFGQQVTEDVAVAATGAVSSYAYVKITSITPTVIGTPGAVTCGWNPNDASVRMSVGLPFKVKSGDIDTIQYAGNVPNTSPTVDETYATLELEQSTMALCGAVTVVMSQTAWLKY